MPPTSVERVEATYQKANLFRVVHADGCYGGLTPHGNVHFAFYSERAAIPRRVEFEVVDGVPTPERNIEAIAGLFREVDVDVVMNFSRAVQFHLWLRGHLETISQQMGVTPEEWQNMTQRPK